MKSTLTTMLGFLGAIACFAPAHAQVAEPTLVTPRPQSNVLMNQPLEIERSSKSQELSSLSKTKLNTVAESIQAHPEKANGESIAIPGNLSDLIRVPSKPLSDSHPLEQFQPPAPDRSIGINLNRL